MQDVSVAIRPNCNNNDNNKHHYAHKRAQNFDVD